LERKYTVVEWMVGKEVERYGRVERKYFEMDGWKGSTVS
jgi:hypothetical protein